VLAVVDETEGRGAAVGIVGDNELGPTVPE
jgi:hypothetical protein